MFEFSETSVTVSVLLCYVLMTVKACGVNPRGRSERLLCKEADCVRFFLLKSTVLGVCADGARYEIVLKTKVLKIYDAWQHV